MKLTHPLADRNAALPQSVAYAPGKAVPVAADGTFDVPDEHGERVADALAHRFSVSVADITAPSAELCGTEMSDGDICERLAAECPYHSEET